MIPKKEIYNMLHRREFGEIASWAASSRKALSFLTNFSYETDTFIRGRAFEALAAASRKRVELSPDGIEDIREILRRLIWTMNDESGGVGWFSGEASGVILAAVPQLIQGYGILLSSFMHTFPFEPSVHRGLTLISALEHGVYSEVEDSLWQSIEHENPEVRGYAAYCLQVHGSLKGNQLPDSIKEDTNTFEYYDYSSGNVLETTVSKAAVSKNMFLSFNS